MLYISCTAQGLLDAIRNILQEVEHRCYCRHLYFNWRKKHERDNELHKLFWACAKNANMPYFDTNMLEMKKLTP